MRQAEARRREARAYIFRPTKESIQMTSVSTVVTGAQLALKAAPQIIQLVHSAEQLFPQQGSKLQKLEYVGTALDSVREAAPDLIADWKEFRDAAGKLVDDIVALYNKIGIFKKS